jgi:hypothetical protein
MTKTEKAEPQFSDEKTVKFFVFILEKHKLFVMNSIRNLKGKANYYVTWFDISAFGAKLSQLHNYIYQ